MAHRGHPPGPNTRRLLVEHGGFHYDRDALNDELPCWVTVGGMPHLVIPYSYETNDNRCDQSNGFAQSDDFCRLFRYRDAWVDQLMNSGRVQQLAAGHGHGTDLNDAVAPYIQARGFKVEGNGR